MKPEQMPEWLQREAEAAADHFRRQRLARAAAGWICLAVVLVMVAASAWAIWSLFHG